MKLNNKGFTLLELLIATTVFSVILLLCTFGLIQVGRNYYKGITLSRAQNSARSVMNLLTQSVQYSGSNPVGDLPEGTGPNSGVFCVGTVRFEYKLNSKVGDPNAYALRTSNCNEAIDQAQKTEQVGKGMSLQSLKVQPAGAGSYNIGVKILYGDSDQLTNGACTSGAGSQFCAVSALNTIVQPRL